MSAEMTSKKARKKYVAFLARVRDGFKVYGEVLLIANDRRVLIPFGKDNDANYFSKIIMVQQKC
jgi:hypothetical protein